MSEHFHSPAPRILAGEAARPARAPRPGDRSFEVPAERLLQDWKEAHDRALAYLQALGVATEERRALAVEAVTGALRRPWDAGSNAVSETLRAVREIVAERSTPVALRDGTADRFLSWRLAAVLSGPSPSITASGTPSTIPVRDGAVCSMPRLTRRAMVSEPIERGFFRRLLGSTRKWRPRSIPAERALWGSPLRKLRRRLPWTRVAHRRRLLLGVLVLIPTTVASGFMTNVLPQQGRTWLESAIVLFFGALFGWISIGFWTAVLGFFTLVRRRDRFAITSLGSSSGEPEPRAPSPDARTAIVMPICEEPVDRVFAGLQAIHRSLERAGALERFHFFILSDTKDPGASVQEEEAWFEWCRAVDGFDRIFYRRRKVRLERKSGNVADFCRR